MALLLGVVLASTFFAGINIGADTAAKQALDQQLNQIPVDIVVRPDYSYGAREPSLLSSTNATEVASEVFGLEGVIGTEVISGVWEPAELLDDNDTLLGLVRLVGISNNSRVYDGWVGGAPSILENETYVWAGSQNAGKIQKGDTIRINITVSVDFDGGKITQFSFPLNLTVAGFAELDDQALSILSGQYYGGGYYGPPVVLTVSQNYIPEYNILITSWEETFVKLIDFIYELSPYYSPIDTQILVYLDRESLISPWDISRSINTLKAITYQVDNKVSAYGLSATNNLVTTLSMYQFMAIAMRFSFIIVAIPVFFVAWYMGMTVSDVSFNLRRREIGLLLTKGFSRGQLLRMFLGEAFLVGLIAGIIGILLSLSLNPFFVQAVGGEFGGTPVIGPDTIVITVVFSVIIVFLSVFWSARRASRLNAVDALREYMYVEEVKPYKKTWPWVAFILGSYKIVVLLLGINLTAEMMRLGPRNILVFILMYIATFIDGILTYIGPLLFFWGFTKIFIRGSLKFQELTAKAARFLGDLGAMATRNVQRNPARAASVAFLIALIIGYSVQVTGTLASQQDYMVREIYSSVGAEISVSLSSTTNASEALSNVTQLSDVSSAALEHSFTGQSSAGTANLKAVNPEAWLATAYYEGEWFTGNDVNTAFQSLTSNNNTIILERGTAKTLDFSVGDEITLTFGESTKKLEIVGFFGVEPVEMPGVFESPEYYWERYWSYVSEGLYQELSGDVSASVKMLVKLKSGADGEYVANQIRDLDIGVVYSVAERLQEQQANVMFTGMLNVQRLGVAFAILAASIGTALVALVGLKERGKEATLMSVRGLSFKQLVVMLLTENLAVVVFAVLLGAVVGLIIVRGNVAAANAFAFSLVSRRVVFPMDSLLTLLSCFSLVFASTIIPVIVIARRYVSKLERMVRVG